MRFLSLLVVGLGLMGVEGITLDVKDPGESFAVLAEKLLAGSDLLCMLTLLE